MDGVPVEVAAVVTINCSVVIVLGTFVYIGVNATYELTAKSPVELAPYATSGAMHLSGGTARSPNILSFA